MVSTLGLNISSDKKISKELAAPVNNPLAMILLLSLTVFTNTLFQAPLCFKLTEVALTALLPSTSLNPGPTPGKPVNPSTKPTTLSTLTVFG